MRHLICEWWELARASVVQDSQWHPAHLGEWFQINRSRETLEDDSLCKSPALCLCWAWALPSPLCALHKHTTALWLQHPLAIRLQDGTHFYSPLCNTISQLIFRWSNLSSTHQVRTSQKGWICSLLWIQALAGFGGHSFPWDALTRGDYSNAQGENDQENSRKFL